MKGYLDKVFKELPNYLAHFTSCLVKPRHFIETRLASEDHQKAVEEGVSFLILSFIIAMLLSAVLPDASDPMKVPSSDSALVEWGSNTLFNIFMVLAGSAVAYFAWKFVGAEPAFQRFFGFVSFFCGVALVLNVFASATTNLAMLDPVVGKAWVKLERSAKEMKPKMAEMLCAADERTGELNVDNASLSFDKDKLVKQQEQALELFNHALGRPIFKWVLGINLLVMLVLIGWLTMAWFAYGRIQNVATAKIIGAAITTIAILYIGDLLIGMMKTGAETMAMYRNC